LWQVEELEKMDKKAFTGAQAKINIFKGELFENVVKKEFENNGWTVIKIAKQKSYGFNSYGFDFTEEILEIEKKINDKRKKQEILDQILSSTKTEINKIKKKIEKQIKSSEKLTEDLGLEMCEFLTDEYYTVFYNYIDQFQKMVSIINYSEISETVEPFTDDELRPELQDGKIIDLLRNLPLAGLPDFLCLKNGKVKFTEVKSDAITKTKWHQVGRCQQIKDAGHTLEIIEVKEKEPAFTKIQRRVKMAEFNNLNINWEKIKTIDKQLFDNKKDEAFPMEDYILTGKKH
jgi:hypothetical protein